ncbi:Uncharacterized protein BP5553_08168 [Venustampulla echinocandica]|uniref:MHD domain-containing protein n=1 Tax=Venustampulla echinocandica TaxID=2656787 RepID=A0A370TFX6_9HELO|nr:Uncharacterized protein BP5553_08168 [Venustampulla echinocandica]RDL33800.1 Uncharacterized protein BP5553_08168 [Venustampulla echinocandica]
MEALSRQEYPGMLERLQPAGAVAKFNERAKRIGKLNTEIADWLQERRKVEEAYIAGLKKLARRPLQEVGGDMGIFGSPWKKIISSTEEIANSHSVLSQRIEKDVEVPLRTFTSTNREMQHLSTIQGNLASMAKELDDAQDKSDKLSRKGGRANSQKVDQATSKLQTAEQQWNSQAPFIFESLQSIDETRLNHLRDVLTQYETHQADLVERNRIAVEQALSTLLEVDTSQEIKNWSQATVAGKPVIARRTKQSLHSENSAASSMPPPATPRSTHTDNQSEHSGKHERENLKSRFGTMLNRRRQSIHGGFARAPSPSKGGFVPFGRNSGSRDGRPSPSPRASSNNLQESPSRDNRLSSLAESPPLLSPASATNGNANGVTRETSNISDVMTSSSPTAINGTTLPTTPDLSGVQPPPGPPPSHTKESKKDAEGFTVRETSNDPISLAQQEAAQDSDQPQFKLDIRKDPIPEQDADARAALSNVANTLRSSQMAPPSRKLGTVRGRRDVRNTIFVPAGQSLDVSIPDLPAPPSPNLATGRAAALAAISGEQHSAPSISDTTSIRSGHSLSNHAFVKHAEMHRPGLNASIIETLSASFENGVIITSKIGGEIALAYNRSTDDDSPLPPDKETIRINNFPNLEVIGPNRTFIHPVSTDKPDEFTVDLSSINSKTSVAFTYRVHTDESNIHTQGPLFLKPAWKQQGDKLNLVIEYHLNPTSFSTPLTFHNLVLVATYEGARAIGCQTKPTGTHIKEKSLVYWRLGDVTLNPDEPHKVIARFVGMEGAVPTPGHVEARWEIHNAANIGIGSNISLSRLEQVKGKEVQKEEDDPFADESVAAAREEAAKWADVEISRKLISGKYEGRQVVPAA